MPFSNKAGEGFENKIADLLAQKLNVPLQYTWFPQATGFVRNTLGARKCDLVMGFAQGDELVLNTNHYYKSSYVLVVPENSTLAGVENLSDERLKGKKIGIIAGTPPANVMAMNGLIAFARPYHLMVDRRFESPAEDMIKDMKAGEIDAGILWGPMGGYYAKKSDTPMKVIPLVKEQKGPRLTYRITMGLRPNEQDWKHQVNDLIKRNQEDINAILMDFGVPLLDEQDRLITNAAKTPNQG